MIYLKTYTEASSYLTLNDGDDYQITQVKRDGGHDYEYCDGVMYELSGNDTTVYIDEIEHTDENMFYQDQIERYVQYIEDGGIIQTFPVQEHSLADRLDQMLDYLDERDNFDITWDILNKHEKLFNIFMKLGLYNINDNPEDFGFGENETSYISSKEGLDKYYNDEDEEYDEELYLGFCAIIKYFDDNKTYTLTDFNHRFAALKDMGKKNVLVEVI